MKRNIDIDMYKDGFNTKKVNCIQNPIAVSAGYFERINYFYYCYLYCFLNYFENGKFKKEEEDFITFSNQILSIMGLCLKSADFGEDYEKALKIITEEISNNCPVFIVCKYNTLFYNSYYKNYNFKLAHGLIISGYNDENETFTINESSLLRNILAKSENSDIYFPLQINKSALKEIIQFSNPQFLDEKYDSRNFYNNIFFVVKEKSIILETHDIINKSLDIIKESDFNKNSFIIDVKKYDPIKITMSNFNYENYFRKYVLGLEPIFTLLKIHAHGNEDFERKIRALEEDVRLNKKNIISKFIKKTIKKEKLTNEQKKAMIESWKKKDQLIINLIKELSQINKTQKLHYLNLNLDEYYNCKAFEETISDHSTADITGEGTHFLLENIPINDTWQNGDYEFVYNYASWKNDNISCQGQIIKTENDFETSSISFLSCSEYGSYQEIIKIQYIDGKHFEFVADFSDFFQLSIFDEKNFWSGVALDRKNGKTVPHNFSARLFAKRYDVPLGIITSIQLPNRKNIHIFAVTFEIQA